MHVCVDVLHVNGHVCRCFVWMYDICVWVYAQMHVYRYVQMHDKGMCVHGYMIVMCVDMWIYAMYMWVDL